MLATITIIPGPILLLIYNTVIHYYPDVAINFVNQKASVATILASFAFTMLGFLAAVITILFIFLRARSFTKYKNKGFLDIFFSLYFVTIISLIITFGLSILSLSTSNDHWALRSALIWSVNNLVQIALLTAIIVNLARKAIASTDVN